MNLDDLLEEGHDYDEHFPDPILPPEAPYGPALDQWLESQSIRTQECTRDIARLLRAYGWRMVQAALSDALRGLDEPDLGGSDGR